MSAIGMGSNDRHPELRSGEIFLRNDADNGFARVKAVLPSARQGEIGYNIRGKKLDDEAGLKPIFVAPDELRAAGGPLMLEVRYAELAEQQ
ncbi:hypothetical protein [Bradyrhizobium nanningense]|uniref:hypothetical protein n=1 Tax=Bradyrhizobium nanningense TaxID=1325118 RepID=UPI00100895D0|nr:hypothetical protein [Bradyrhizobium nanningense]